MIPVFSALIVLAAIQVLLIASRFRGAALVPFAKLLFFPLFMRSLT